MYTIEPVGENVYELRQEDKRYAAGYKVLGTGTPDEMEVLKGAHEGRRKTTLRLDPKVDEALEALKHGRNWDKQACTDEALHLWLAFAADPDTLHLIRGAMSATGRAWTDVAAELCRDWVRGRVAWAPVPGPIAGKPVDPLAITDEERAAWREHMGDRDPAVVWEAIQALGYDSGVDWFTAHVNGRLAGQVAPAVRPRLIGQLGNYLAKSLVKPQ